MAYESTQQARSTKMSFAFHRRKAPMSDVGWPELLRLSALAPALERGS
jgi:hypothetical protein